MTNANKYSQLNLTDPTWRMLIADEMSDRGETWADVVYCTLSDAEIRQPI